MVSQLLDIDKSIGASTRSHLLSSCKEISDKLLIFLIILFLYPRDKNECMYLLKVYWIHIFSISNECIYLLYHTTSSLLGGCIGSLKYLFILGRHVMGDVLDCIGYF